MTAAAAISVLLALAGETLPRDPGTLTPPHFPAEIWERPPQRVERDHDRCPTDSISAAQEWALENNRIAAGILSDPDRASDEDLNRVVDLSLESLDLFKWDTHHRRWTRTKQYHVSALGLIGRRKRSADFLVMSLKEYGTLFAALVVCRQGLRLARALKQPASDAADVARTLASLGVPAEEADRLRAILARLERIREACGRDCRNRFDAVIEHIGAAVAPNEQAAGTD